MYNIDVGEINTLAPVMKLIGPVEMVNLLS